VPEQSLHGRVTRDGRPVQCGWVALCVVPRAQNAPNAYVLRGRTTVGERVVYAEVPLRDGAYTLAVPFQGKAWYVVVEEPGQPPTLAGPVAVGLNERRTLDVACADGGSVTGRVKAVARGFEGQLWAVAFSDAGYRAEARVRSDGSFRFVALLPGEYGLKVGHNAYVDTETQVKWPDTGRKWTKEESEAFQNAWDAPAEPWKRARRVRVEAGREAGPVELELP
jgi:hypothetical protein